MSLITHRRSRVLLRCYGLASREWWRRLAMGFGAISVGLAASWRERVAAQEEGAAS